MQIGRRFGVSVYRCFVMTVSDYKLNREAEEASPYENADAGMIQRLFRGYVARKRIYYKGYIYSNYDFSTM